MSPAASSPDTSDVLASKAGKRAGVTVNDVYERLKEMVVRFEIRPGERLNEVELAEALNVSRTPLRTALHRLVAENMLNVVPNRGFYIKQLARQEVFDLYELRNALECAAIAHAVKRAKDEDIAALRADWTTVMTNSAGFEAHQLVIEDERFHVALARLSGNAEMAGSLHAINARIHFVRWIDLESNRDALYEEHLSILDALAARDRDRCLALVDTHISRRMEEIVSVIQAGVIRLYAP